MVTNATGYYLWPPVWIGSPARAGEEPDLKAFQDEIFTTQLLNNKLAVRVVREGQFIFDFSIIAPGNSSGSFDPGIEIALKRTRILNVHLLFLYDAVARHQNFAPVRMVLSPGDLLAYGSYSEAIGSTLDLANQQIAFSSMEHTYPVGIPKRMDYRMIGRELLVIQPPTLADSFDKLDQILCDPRSEELIVLLDMLATAAGAFEQNDFPRCLIQSWAIAEQIICALWDKYVAHGTVVIIEQKQKVLKPAAEYAVAIKINTLVHAGILSTHLFARVDQVRDARNGWMHSLGPIPREMAAEALVVAHDLLNQEFGLTIAIALTSRSHG